MWLGSQLEHLCRLAEAGRGWPRLEAALRLIRRWPGVLEGEVAGASERLSLSSTQRGTKVR